MRDEHQVRVDAFGLGLAEFDLDLSWGLFHDPSPVPTQSSGREAEDARAERVLRGPGKVGAERHSVKEKGHLAPSLGVTSCLPRASGRAAYRLRSTRLPGHLPRANRGKC